MDYTFWQNMTHKSCTTWVLLLGLLWIFPVSPVDGQLPNDNATAKLENCFNNKNKIVVVAERFYDVITKHNPWNYSNACIVFLQINSTINSSLDEQWPQEDTNNKLYISKHITNQNADVYVMSGTNCSNQFDLRDSTCVYNHTVNGSCSVTCLNTGTVCQKTSYDGNYCKNISAQTNGMYIINITSSEKNCVSCDNPVKIPETTIQLNLTEPTVGGKTDAAGAAKIMNQMADLASTMVGSSAALSVGDGITGVMVAHKNPVDIEAVSFAYASPNESINVVSSGGNLADFSRSVSVSKEAFDKALSLNVSTSFAALLRFNNMAGDELNSTLLGNEVLAVEMGANITNLTDPIKVTFRSVKYIGTPSCRSWNGDGSQPNWTDVGCTTITNGSSITCQCTHLTFFAILMAAPNQTISSSDLNNLTIITQVGCGLSMFFLSIILFMHFLMRKTKANTTTRILIHLVVAMFLLNFTFLINSFVANMKNSLACQIMAAFMHYLMLATFTWFAAHAFHLCFQLHTGGKIVIHRYILKLSIITWVLPSIVGIVLLSIGKYGEQVISTGNTANNVAMCWITDINVHYIVNIGYYALVFLFTFTTFIIIVSWLSCLKRSKGGTVQLSRNSRSIVSVLGLCCMLGVTWGFAFFAYGVLQIPAYYIFTILNSFQGFFLFIYYYNTRQTTPADTNTGANRNSTSSTTTLQTNLDVPNPYITLEK